MIVCVHNYTSTYARKWGTIGQKTVVCICAKISRKKSRMQGNRIVESTSTNWQNYPINKPDLIIRDNEKGTCMLTEVAIPGDRHVIKKEAEKILKYEEVTIEIQRMWNVKTKVIWVIIGANGTTSKSFRKYVSNIPGKNEVKEIQKAAILALHTYFGKY